MLEFYTNVKNVPALLPEVGEYIYIYIYIAYVHMYSELCVAAASYKPAALLSGL
jgi:hypothetical protein